MVIIQNPTALGLVLLTAGILLHDRGDRGHLFFRDRRFRFHRISISGGETLSAIAQVSSDYTFVRGDEAIAVILGLGMIERASMRPTCLLPTVSPDDAVTHPRTLAELAAGLMLGKA